MIPIYTPVKEALPKQGFLVKVSPNDAETAFIAIRKGRKWEVVHWSTGDWGNFFSKIHRNDFWTYWSDSAI